MKDGVPHYDCYYDNNQKIHSGCKEQVACQVNTGDFRMVLADSHGKKQTKDGFGTLENHEVSGGWQGVEWRFSPHTAKKWKRPKGETNKYAFPATISFKNSVGPSTGFFSTSKGSRHFIPETCDYYFAGNFERP